ncbi:MAG: precorrin-6Y C5,15-methyltransferase (decarboxylating) subunit CbiT, partial [Clostridia bacterium]|nr:precorrin-6Y C5,15-methyltransferase (decarboxylating) subunit CbiT [Clostridia bacterium]
MRIGPDAVIWDIGAGTGSVAIEAARLAPRGHAYAIEKNAEDVANIRENVARFGVGNVTVVHGRAPAGLEAWPDPDAVFVGGSGGEMGDILAVAARRLRPGGRIVVNLATLENLSQALTTLRGLGLEVAVTLVQVARSRPVLDLTRLEALDPVFVVTA